MQGKIFTIPQKHIVVAGENVSLINSNPEDRIIITCYPTNLLSLHQQLIAQAALTTIEDSCTLTGYKTLPVDDCLIHSTEKLMLIEKSLPICLLYLYCLGTDKHYFSMLFHQLVSFNINSTLLEFFDRHYLKQWAVSRYATELGISVHKLNVIFQQKYGMPVKQWLIEQRLRKGGELLLTTNQRVADIALECGFSNHAHFTALFRRRFELCPSVFRAMGK
ncbi:helix-turn-helix domain-containing protein [Biostraticola tofi]|uniref:AraC family transcriptional regulator n=1 Tax=Biostraticola tofi TaxID=466109 RepID=A0A4R3Z046_9GAMM|nr:AraC family transcriptional regulator [Biostraticola tofi]TCV98202.1 AraC family transcriptional regulator [Biostraticola tofi]